MKTLEQLVGQKLVIGIPGTKITPAIVRHFRELNAGGLILYRINFDSPAQLKKLISDLESALERKILVTADHEGGRVIMFRDGVTVFPDNLAAGTAGKAAYAKQQGGIESRELRRLGIDVNLAPTLDVITDAYSPNIGIRSYGKDWRTVAELGIARIQAMQKGGVSACAKHFPGKGHSPLDAHLSLPTIRSTWKEMRATHLKPFEAAIEAGVDVIMSSHPYYPNLDPEPGMIATFSRRIVHDTLRREMGFKGIISSDDLEMGAIKEMGSIGEAAVRTVHAGHDLVLSCHDLAAQKEVYLALLEAYRTKKLPVRELEESVERIQNLKDKRPERFEGGQPRAEVHGKKLAEKICLESVSVLKDKRRILPLTAKAVKDQRTAVIFPQFSFYDAKIMIEREAVRETQFVRREFGLYQVKPKVQIVSIEPSEGEIERAGTLARDADITFLFIWDARLYPSNRKLLETVQARAKTAVVVLLRDPYDADLVSDDAACVTDFGWRVCQMKACIRKIFK